MKIIHDYNAAKIKPEEEYIVYLSKEEWERFSPLINYIKKEVLNAN